MKQTLLKLGKDGRSCTHFFAIFTVSTFEKYEQCFFYKILILIQSKNINAFCFKIIINQTNHDYIF